MLKLIKKEYVTVLEWIFKISYLLLGLATFNSFLYGSSVQPVLVKICLVVGVLTLAGRILFFRDYIKTPFWIMLVLFCVSFFVTILVNRGYGQTMADFKWLIWTGMLFFLLYAYDTTKDMHFYEKEFSVLAHIMIIYGVIASLMGIGMMIGLYHDSWFTSEGEQMLAGFQWERLWGIYTDPNYGAVFSVVVILLCAYFSKKVRTWGKAVYIVAIVLNFLYLVFSDSRTGEVCMVVTVAFWFMYSAIFKWRMRKGILLGILTAAIFAVVFMGTTSYIKSQVNVNVQQQINKKVVANKSKKKISPGKKKSVRKADIQKDVSNGRFALWQSGVEIWKTKPILGTGYNSFLPYVKEKLPETYAVNNSQGEYVSLHDTYLNVLVYQGLVGAVIFIMFGILVLKRWIQGISKIEENERDYIAVLTACVIAVSVAMVFILEGLYTNSPGSFILWTFLGYLMHGITRQYKDKIKVERR